MNSGPALVGQIVVVIGGGAGIGLETARCARHAGAEVIITGRRDAGLPRTGEELGARAIAEFDAADVDQLEAFIDTLPAPIDHLFITGPPPYRARLHDLEFLLAHRDAESRLWLPLRVAYLAGEKVRGGGTLLFLGCTGAQRPSVGLSASAAVDAGIAVIVRSLAMELAPVRVNLIAVGFVDTRDATDSGETDLEQQRELLRRELPIGRLVGPADVGALAVHLMTNTAITGATVDIDGGEQLVRR